MTRQAYINQQVLGIYSMLTEIRFPIDPISIIALLPNCRYMSYQKLAEISGHSIEDIIMANESESGCTHYDIKRDRYLILCNQSPSHNNNPGRQRWTCGHEIGHVVCKHHVICACEKMAENGHIAINPKYEEEADYFAATLLAPFPLFDILNIRSPIDVQNIFGLSTEASLYRFQQYMKWKVTRRKTAWENDMIRLYRQKAI